jgi:hypothetical protein
MEILENHDEWFQDFEAHWLAHFYAAGDIDWKLYHYSVNSEFPEAPPLKLSESKLLLVTSSGAYLHHSQEPFDAANKLGDYQIRKFDSETPFEKIDYSHEHYDQSYVRQDPQVLLPLQHLENLAVTRVIGKIAPEVVSFMGYQPNVSRVIDITIPEVVSLAQENQVDGVFLVPS